MTTIAIPPIPSNLENPALIRFLNDLRTQIIATFSGLSVSAIQSIQTGYVAAGVAVGGAGEELKYYDQTVTAVLDVNKCDIHVTSYNGDVIGGRMSSTTNLKVMRPAGGAGTFHFRYWLIEYV